MKIKGIHLILFFFNLFFCLKNYSQSIELLGVEAGLSNNIVYDVAKDDKGFMWFATEKGLNRYNGYSFKKFNHNANDSTSISSNVCRNILKDKKGNLWIATKNGISLFDEITETFVNYSIADTYLDIQELELVGDDKIWFNTLGKAGFFDIKKKEFHLVNNNYNSFCITSNTKKVWISSAEGSLDVASKNNGKLTHLKKNIGVRKQIHFGSFTNKLWLPKGYELLQEECLIIPELPNKIEPTKLLEIDKNTLLLGSNQGLFEYKIDSKKIIKILLTEKITSLNQQIRSIYKDDIGAIWIGTLGGVFHIDDYKKSFQHLSVDKNTDAIIMGLESSKKGLYFNQFGKGVYEYSSTENTFNEIDISTDASEKNSFIWDIKQVPENNYSLWFATDKGLVCYNPKTRKSKEIPLPKGKDFFKNSFNLCDYDENFMWVASHTGIHKVVKKGEIKPVLSVVDIIKEANIQKILALNHQVFIATEGRGLFVYDEKTNQIKPIYQSNKQIINPTIWDMILVDKTIWLGTNEGLYTLDTKSLEIQKIAITNNIIFSIQKDDFNRFWMGTDKGLMSYHLETKFTDIYTKEEGVINTEFNRRSVAKTKDGQLWFGGVKGLTHFYPSKIKENKIVPPVYISKLEIITSDSTFTFNHRKEKSIVLPYNQNTISLEYVALNYTNPTQNKYKYQLEGRDLNWVEDKGNRFSRYTQLPAGKYNFKVIASNNDGVWNTKGAELSIEILPPFWQTIWFQILVILLIFGIIYTIYYYKVKRLLAIERMKLRIASDLHDEVGSGLSGIALTSDILEQQYEKGEVKPQLLKRITKNARNLASTLDDIVWLINPEKEALEDFLLKTRTLAKELLEDIHINFKNNISDADNKKMLSPEQKRNLFLFTKEAINNINKHANAKNVEIEFELFESQFYLKIKDDGQGFDTNKKTTRNGLISMKNRAVILKGKLDITSKKSEGTAIVLQIKIP